MGETRKVSQISQSQDRSKVAQWGSTKEKYVFAWLLSSNMSYLFGWITEPTFHAACYRETAESNVLQSADTKCYNVLTPEPSSRNDKQTSPYRALQHINSLRHSFVITPHGASSVQIPVKELFLQTRKVIRIWTSIWLYIHANIKKLK